jgi:hypothetical protein
LKFPPMQAGRRKAWRRLAPDGIPIVTCVAAGMRTRAGSE